MEPVHATVNASPAAAMDKVKDFDKDMGSP